MTTPTDRDRALISENTEELNRLVLDYPLETALNPATEPDLLAVLAGSDDYNIVHAVANNPNTPTAILWGLAENYPDAVINNPVWNLLLVENPNILFSINSSALRSLCKTEKFKNHYSEFFLKHFFEKNLTNPSYTYNGYQKNHLIADLWRDPIWRDAWNKINEERAGGKTKLKRLNMTRVNTGATIDKNPIIASALNLKFLDFERGEFHNSQILKSVFSGSTFNHCVFQKCYLPSNDFTRASIDNCTFVECDLKNSDFSHSGCSEAKFIRCNLTGVKFNRSNLIRSQFKFCEGDRLDFTGANLDFAQFSYTEFRRTSFKNVASKTGLFEQYHRPHFLDEKY